MTPIYKACESCAITTHERFDVTLTCPECDKVDHYMVCTDCVELFTEAGPEREARCLACLMGHNVTLEFMNPADMMPDAGKPQDQIVRDDGRDFDCPPECACGTEPWDSPASSTHGWRQEEDVDGCTPGSHNKALTAPNFCICPADCLCQAHPTHL